MHDPELFLRRVAHHFGTKSGLSQDAINDFEQEFLLRMVRKAGGWQKFFSFCENSKPLIYKCAVQFSIDAYRKETLRSIHEKSLAYYEVSADKEAGSEKATVLCRDVACNPAVRVEIKIFWEVVSSALHSLPTLQRECFEKHHLEGVSAQQIATHFKKSTPAIEQALFRARKNFIKALAEQGYDRAEFASIISPPPPRKKYCKNIFDQRKYLTFSNGIQLGSDRLSSSLPILIHPSCQPFAKY